MSATTLRLFTSTDFLVGLFLGATALLTVVALAALTKRPSPIGGLLLSGAMVVALWWRQRLPITLLAGLVLLAVAGWLVKGPPVGVMAATIPGATAVAAAFRDSSQPLYIVLVLTTIVLGAHLVASFDEIHQTSTLGTTLMAISFVAVLLTVPDTDEAIVIAGVAIPFLVAGPPFLAARLGNAGALTSTALLIWVATAGGNSRPGSVVAGIAALGLLIAVPAATAVRREMAGHQPAKRRRGTLKTIPLIVLQVAVGLAVSETARAFGDQVVVAAVIVAVILAIAAAWATSPARGY